MRFSQRSALAIKVNTSIDTVRLVMSLSVMLVLSIYLVGSPFLTAFCPIETADTGL